jgi:hypothetical protein
MERWPDDRVCGELERVGASARRVDPCVDLAALFEGAATCGCLAGWRVVDRFVVDCRVVDDRVVVVGVT